MGKHGRIKALFIAALCLNVANSGPLSKVDLDYAVDDIQTLIATESRCSSHCPTRSTPWTYEVGSTYTYSYSVETSTSMKGTSDQESKLGLKATVKITPNTQCDFTMKVSDVSLTEGDSSEFAEALTKHEVQFSFVDGRISDVCGTQDEAPWVRNIKKGILSAFQMSSEDWTKSQNITETDVVGTCSTEYVPTGLNLVGHTTFQKQKKMDSCKNNQKLFQFALNLPDFNVQHMSLIESDHLCDIQLFEGRLQKSVCQENHIFKPFSSGQHGATTFQEQTIEFVSSSIEEKILPSGDLSKKSDLLFEHFDETQDAEMNRLIVVNILSYYSNSDESVRPELFTSLVHSLRHLPHSQLAHIFYQITDFSTRKFVLDAIPILRTDAAVTLMRDIITSGQLNDVTLDNWYAALALYKNPTRAMITTVTTFLGSSPRQSALLAISSLVRTFCESQTDCQLLPEVQDIILKYEEFLGNDCGGDNLALEGEDEDRIILSLKGLRNIGHVVRSASVLEKCYQETSNSMYIRLAALDTLRMLSCKSKIHEPTLMKTFTDTEMDTELRIGAYLAIMNCPAGNTIETVKNVLTSEPVNQVGSFVWTHLTNLQESQSLSPNKIQLKKLVGDRFLKNKWNTDVRKFSRYFETSYYAKDIKAGATAEGNLIFSQESYLPRSAMVNLTVNIFGENLNLLELGGRAEGFEPLVEGLFGQDGRFREDTFHKLLQGVRNKRDINDFQSTFNSMREGKPKGNFYLKTFGRDTHYSSFHGINELVEKVSFWPNSLFGSNWNGNDIDFRRSSIFLDGSIVVPTASGLPLKLSVNGTSTVGLKSSTSLNIKSFFTDGKMSAEAHIYPSATVQITGLMEVDAKTAKTGLKSVTKLHSSTFLDGKVIIDGGKLAKVEVNMPRDTMEILEASADFYTWQHTSGDTNQNIYVPLESNNAVEVFQGCSAEGKELIGLEICGTAKYHYVPENDLAMYFTGPSLAKLILKKTDPFQKYVFEYSWSMKTLDDESKVVNDLKVTYDTPGSVINRRSSIELKFDNIFSYLALSLEIPINKVNADLVYNWTPEKKMLKAGVTVERKNVIFLYTIFKAADDQGRYGAEARVTWFDADFLRWMGTVVLAEKRKSLDLKLEGSLHSPIKVTSDLYINTDRYDLSSTLKSTMISIDLSAQLRHTDTSLALKGDCSYKIPDVGSHKILIDGSYQMETLGKLLKHHAQISVNPSQFPKLSTDLSWNTQLSSDYIENAGKLRIGSRAYAFEQVFSSQANDQIQELLFKLAVTDVVTDSQYKIDFLHRVGKMESNNRLAISFHRNHIEAYASHKMTASPSTSLNISAGLTFPGGHNYAAGFEVGQQQSNDFVGKTFVRWGSDEELDKRISADFNFQKGNEAFLNYGFSVTLNLPNLQTMTSTGTLVVDPSAGSILQLGWSRNNRHYSAEIEYNVVDLDHQLDAILTVNNVEYKATLRASDRDVKSIYIEIMAEKHIVLDAQAKDNFKNLKVDIYWDKSVDEKKSISLKSEISSREIQLKFRVLDNSGDLTALYVDDTIKVEAKYNNHYINAKASHSHEASNYGLEGEMTSSFEGIRDVKMVARAALIKSDSNVAVLDSKILFKWNAIHHSLTLIGEKSTKLKVLLTTSSTYEPLDDCVISLDHQKSGKEISTSLEASYQRQNVTFVLWHSNSKAKEGLIKLTTPCNGLKSLNAEYKLTFGKTIHYIAKIDHNNGDNAVSVDVEGHLRTGDVNIRGNIEHTWGDDLALGLGYKSDISDVALISYLKIGENRGFNLTGSASTALNRLAHISANAQYFSQHKPVDFTFKYLRAKSEKLELESKLIYSGVETFTASILADGENEEGNVLRATGTLFDCRLDVEAECGKIQSEYDALITNKFLNATYSAANKVNSNLYISHKRNLQYSPYTSSQNFEIKLVSPNLESGITTSTYMNSSNGFDFERGMVISAYGLNEKFSLTVDAVGFDNLTVDFKSSFPFINHLTLQTTGKIESYDEGITNSLTVRGSINGGNEFVFTGKDVTENNVDKTVTFAYEGPKGPFLLSGTLRRTVPFETQLEYLYVDSSLKEHSAFAAFGKLGNKFAIRGNWSSPSSELVQFNAAVGYGGEGEMSAVAKILAPDVWLDFLANIEDDDDTGMAFSGYFNAPGFDINPKRVMGTFSYGRGDVIISYGIRIEEVDDFVLESRASFDLGSKSSDDLGEHFFVEIKSEIVMTDDEQPWEKKLVFNGGLSHDLNHFKVEVETPCESFKDLKFVAKTNDEWDSLETEFTKNEDKFSLLASFANNEVSEMTVTTRVQSTFHDFENFDLDGKINFGGVPKVLEVSAKSGNGAHVIEVKGQIEDTKGSLKLTAILPVIEVSEKDFQVQFNLNNLGGDAVIFARGKVYDVHWEKELNDIRALISTPIIGYEKIRVDSKLLTAGHQPTVEVSVQFNDVLTWQVKSHLDYKNYNAKLALKTPHPCLSSFETTFELVQDTMRGIKFGVSYKDESLASVEAVVSRDYHVSNLLIKFRDDHSLSFEHSLKGIEIIDNDINGPQYTTLTPFENEGRVSFTLDTPCSGEHSIKTSWNLTKEKGVARFTLENGDHETKVVANYNHNTDLRGIAELRAFNLPIINTFSTVLTYDVGTTEKTVSLLSKWSDDKFSDLNLTYRMTVDTFDGDLVVKTSKRGWELTTFKAKYNISARPSASVSYEKDGVTKELQVEVVLDKRKPIPTIYITTPFDGYEHIILSGEGSRRDNKITSDFTVTCNGKKIIVFTNKIVTRPDFSIFELSSSLLTPIENWRSLQLEFGYKTTDPWAAKVKFVREGVEYSIKGKISINDKEFKINVATPFEDYESVGLSGKFGTTSIGRQFGVSFEQNAVRRDVAVEYGVTPDNVASLEVRTPLRQVRSLKLESDMFSDDPSSRMNFGFETSGENNDFALGLMYDLTQGITNGKARIKISAGPLMPELSDVELNLVLSESAAEYSGKLTFKMFGSELVTAETKIASQKASVRITTPVPDYSNIFIQIDSNFGNRANLIFELNGVQSSVTAELLAQEHFKIIIKTPMVGYELVQATYQLLSNGTRQVVVDRSGKRISTLLITTELSGLSGKINVDWVASSNIWAKLTASYNNGNGKFLLQTFSPQLRTLKFDFDVQIEETKTTTNLSFAYNDFFFDYSSWSTADVRTNYLYEGWSETKSNIDYIGSGTTVTTYKVQLSKDFSVPAIINYKHTKDGEPEIDIETSLDIQIPRGFDLNINIYFPLVLLEKVSAKVALTTEITGQHKSAKLVGSLAHGPQAFSIAVEGKLTDKDFTFIVKSELGKVDEMKGKVSWAAEGKKTKVNFVLLLNGVKQLQGSVTFDKNPFTRVLIVAQKDERTKQEIDIRVAQTPGKYQLSVVTKGFMEARLDSSVTVSGPSAILDVKFKGSTPIGPQDLVVSASTKFGDGAYEVDIRTQNNRENRERRFKAGVNFQSPLVASVEVRGQTLPFELLPTFQVQLDFDLSNDLKKLVATFDALNIRYAVDAKANWSPQSSVINVEATGTGGYHILFKGERTGLTAMKYALDIMGTVISFESNNNIRSPTDFDILAKIDIPFLQAAPQIILKLSHSQNVKATESHSLIGSVAIQQNEVFSIKFSRASNGEFELTASTPIPEVSSLEFKHIHTPAKDAVNGHLNEYNLKWNNNHILLNYKTVANANDIATLVRLVNLDVAIEKIKITSSATMTHAKLYTLKIDTASGNPEFHLDFEAKFTETAETIFCKLDENIFPGDNLRILNIVYTKKSKLEISYQNNPTEKIEAAITFTKDTEGSGGRLLVDLKNNFWDGVKKVHFDGSAHYTLAKKSGTLILNYDDKNFSLEATATKEELELLVSTPIPGIEYLKFETEFEANKYTAELDYGKKGSATALHVEVELNSKETNVKFFKFEANRGSSGYALSGKIDLQSKTFSSEASWNGKQLSLTTNYNNGNLKGLLKTPFYNFENVNFEGKWEMNANGATFKAVGDVNSLKHTFEASYATKENGFMITWRAAKGASDEIVFKLDCSMISSQNMQAKLSLTGTAFQPLTVEGRYEITNNKFRSGLVFVTPYEGLPHGEAQVQVGFDLPFSYEFKALVMTDIPIFDVDLALSLAAANNKFLRMGASIPALGIHPNDLKLDFGYKVVSPNDFEIVTELTFGGVPRRAALKFKLVDTKLDGELTLQLASTNINILFGGKFIRVGTGYTVSGHVNDCNFELTRDGKNLDGKVLLDFSNKLFGLVDLVQVGVPNPITLDVKYEHLKAAKFAVKLGLVNPQSFNAAISIGNDRALVGFEITTPTIGHRSASIVVEYGPRGRLELTVGTGDGTHKLELEAATGGRGLRQGRAALYSPTFGDYEFELDKGSSSGIVVLTTSRGLHKVSYDVKYTSSNTFDIDIQLESPFLNNGHASGKLTVNGESHNYRAMFSLNNDHFISGSFIALPTGFETAFAIQSSYLRSDFQVSISYTNNAKELSTSASLQLFSDKHQAKISIRKDHPYAKLFLLSPWMPWVTLDLEADLKQKNVDYSLDSTIKVGSKTIQLNGVVHLNITNLNGQIYFTGTGFQVSEARINYNHVIGEAGSFVFNLGFTSDHPRFSKINFATTAEIVSEDEKHNVALFSIVTPFTNFESLSGKVYFPKLLAGFAKDSHVELEVTLPKLRTHNLLLKWKCQTDKFASSFVYVSEGEEIISVEGTLWKASNYLLRFDLKTPFSALSTAKLELEINKISLKSVDVQTRLEFNDVHKYGARLVYQLDCMYVSGEVMWPKNHYSLDLGHKNCAGFMAHISTPKGGLGGKFSYLMDSRIDIEALVDFSLLQKDWMDYQKLGFHVEYTAEPNFKANVRMVLNERNTLALKLGSNTNGQLREYKVETILNDFIKVKATAGVSPHFSLSIDAKLPSQTDLVIRGIFIDETYETEVKVNWNNKDRIYFLAAQKKVSIEIRDVFQPRAYGATIVGVMENKEKFTVKARGKICWNLFDEENETESFEVKGVYLANTGHGDFQVLGKWRNGHVSALTATLNQFTTGNIKYQENEATVVQLQYEVDTFYSIGEVAWRKCKYFMSLPDRFFGIEISQTRRSLDFGSEFKLTYGLNRDLPKIQGIVFSRTRDRDDGNIFITEKYSIKKIDSSNTESDQSIVLTLRKEGEASSNESVFSRMAKIKIEHPTDETLRLELKAEAYGKKEGSNIKFTSGFVKKIGASAKREVQLTTELDTVRMTAEGTLITCQNSAYNFKGKLFSYETNFGLESSVTKDGHKFADLTADINSKSPSIQVKTNVGSSTFFAGLQSEKEFVVSMVRIPAGQLIEDATVFAKLSSEDVLTLGATWRPDLVTDIQSSLDSAVSKYRICPLMFSWSEAESVHRILDQFQSSFFEDLSLVIEAPVTKFYESAMQVVENIKSLKIQEYVIVQKVTEFATRGLLVSYEISSYVADKTLRLTTIAVEMVSDLTSSVFVHAKYLLNSVTDCGKNACARITAFMSKYDLNVSRISIQLDKMVLSFKDGLTSFVSWYNNLVESQSGKATVFIKELVKNIEKDAFYILVEVSGFLKQFRIVNDALSFYYEYQSWFEEVHFSEHLENTIQQLQTYADERTQQFDSWKRNLIQIWKETRQFFTTKYDQISQYPIFAYLTTAGRRVHRITTAIIEQFSLDHQFKQMTSKVFGQIDSVVSVIVRIVDVIYGRKDLAGYELDYSPELGVLQYKQVLPFKWYSFKEFPDLFKLVQALGLDGKDQLEGENSDFSFVDFQHDLLDAIQTISTALATRSLVPPFSARAMISGDSHLMTFDNKFYDFAGSQGCSYLLTSDFLHNRFSVVANYGEDQKRSSLTVYSDNKQIEIETKTSVDGEILKVTVDRRQVELPQSFQNTFIKREGSSLILENSEGLRVVCNSAYDVCSVTVSGWYFGKTGGLFGVYDYEPSNDWMTPERRLANDLTDFVSSWQMDKSKICPVKTQIPDVLSVSDADKRKCSEIFGGDDSALMPCYTTIDVTPFHRICLSDAAKENKTGFCSTAAAYIEQCKMAGIELWIPSDCVSCGSDEGQSLISGESISYQNNATLSSDVVFLVEQTSCLDRYNIEELPSVFDRLLNEKGLDNNRFALVGFGGPGSLAKPQIFTSGSKIFGDAIKATASIRNLKTTGIGGHVFEALKYAARLPFRPSVSKSIVLVTCNSGTDGSFYGDVMTMLTEQAIILHHLTAGSTIQWKGNKGRATDKIHGFSKDSVYTVRNLNDNNGDSLLRKQIRNPKDYLSTLAAESGGTVFVLSKFDSDQIGGNKKAATIFGMQVAQRSEPTPCQVCDCVADQDGVGRLHCHKCILPAMDIVLKNWEKYQQTWIN